MHAVHTNKHSHTNTMTHPHTLTHMFHFRIFCSVRDSQTHKITDTDGQTDRKTDTNTPKKRFKHEND